MTKEKMNELLLESLKEFTSDKIAKEVIAEVRKNSKCTGAPTYKIASVILAIENEINAAEAKKTGSSKKLKAIKDLLKEYTKDDLKCGYEYKDYQTFCNGYVMIALKDKIKYETKSEDELHIIGRYNLFDSTINGCLEKNTESVFIPDVKWIEKGINQLKTTLNKRDKDDILVLIDHKYLFNANRLVKCMNIVESNELMTSGKNGLSHFIDNNGNIACIMPIGMKNPDETIMKNNGKLIMIDNGEFSNDLW